MSYVQYEKRYVATYKEIVLAVVTFCVILFVMYPKDFIKDQILNEKSNYDLSMLYLKNMLKNDPENESLMMTLARQTLATGNKDLSIKLLDLLQNSKDKAVREETYILSYKLLKDDYFYLEEAGRVEELKETYSKLEALMDLIVKTPVKSEEDLKNLYNEAVFLKNTKNSYVFVKRLLEIYPDNLTYNKEAFYLASRLSHGKDALKYINKLIVLDPDNSEEWIVAKYYMHLEHSSYKDAEAFLKTKSTESIFWREKLVNFYEYNKKYKNVARMNMSAFEKTTSKKKQRYHWLKAVQALTYGNYRDEALALGLKYEEYFINDKKARVELLKLYIASNALDKASALSKKILKRKLY